VQPVQSTGILGECSAPDAIPGRRSQQGREFLCGGKPRRNERRQPGNVWITTRFGNGLTGKLHLADMGCPCEIWRCRARHGLPQLTFGK
jgi:hypothetical protein